jgi:hypothetical protein
MFGIFLLVVVYNKILPVIWECVFINLLVADKVAVGNYKEAAVLVVAADTSVIGTDFAGEIEGTAVVAYHSHCHS